MALQLSTYSQHLEGSSALNHLNYRVQVFQFDASLLVCKLPFRFHVVFVSMIEPSCHVFLKGAGVGNSPCQALSAQDR